jgi:hypothetical protein
MHALGTAIHSESSQHQYRNGVRHIASHGACCHLMRDSARRHRIVAVYFAIAISHHECAASATQLIRRRPAFEPIIEHTLAALEIIPDNASWTAARVRRLPDSCLIPRRLDRHEALKPRIVGRWRIKKLTELLVALGIETEKHLVKQHSLGFITGSFEHEIRAIFAL